MQTSHSAGGVVIGPQGKITVVSQGGQSWSLPKGHLEPGETPRQAAQREVAEETGLTQLDYLADLGSYTRYRIGQAGGDDHTEHKRLTFYLYRTAQTQLTPTDPANPEARWVDPDEVAAHLTHPADQDFFTGILDQVKSHLPYPRLT